MKILLIMDPGIPIPPTGYGGIERIVAMLALEYNKLGHSVEILGSEGSFINGVKCHSLGPDGFPPRRSIKYFAILKAWKYLLINKNKFDLIHNFGRLFYLLPILHHSVYKIMSYQREVTRRNIKWVTKFRIKNLIFTGCSIDLVLRGNISGKWMTIYNATDFSKYTLVENITEDAPLMFLGRIERVKGCHVAIKAAIETGNKLLIGGNISPLSDEKEYFDREIKPFVDGIQIIFLGPLDDNQKNLYLGQSKALLFPIEWDEPFGIVMIEAMACGTPVIAFRRGSVNEVIDQNITGYKVENIQEMVNAIRNIGGINRPICHSVAKERFDISIIASKYLAIGSVI